MFQKVESISKKTRVVALLREAILSGRIVSGEQIVEGKIAQQLGVGQGLIREALIDLEHQGFVQRTPFSGTQVPKLDQRDAEQIFDIRIELEPLAFALAIEKIDPGKLAELRHLTTNAARDVESEKMDGFFENHLAFRRIAWTVSGNKYLQQTLERLVIPLFALYLIRGGDNRQGLLQTARDCVAHQEMIVAAFEIQDVAQVKRVVRQFLVAMKENLGSNLLPVPDKIGLAASRSPR